MACVVLCEICHSREAVPQQRLCNGCAMARYGKCAGCGNARCTPHSTYCAECMKKRYG